MARIFHFKCTLKYHPQFVSIWTSQILSSGNGFLLYMARICHFKCTLKYHPQFVSVWTSQILSSGNGFDFASYQATKYSREVRPSDYPNFQFGFHRVYREYVQCCYRSKISNSVGRIDNFRALTRKLSFFPIKLDIFYIRQHYVSILYIFQLLIC